jgi:hypothetical protein
LVKTHNFLRMHGQQNIKYFKCVSYILIVNCYPDIIKPKLFFHTNVVDT